MSCNGRKDLFDNSRKLTCTFLIPEEDIPGNESKDSTKRDLLGDDPQQSAFTLVALCFILFSRKIKPVAFKLFSLCYFDYIRNQFKHLVKVKLSSVLWDN